MGQETKPKSSGGSTLGFSTVAIHAGQDPLGPVRSVMTPIFQTSTYAQTSPGEYFSGYDYSRSKNPTRTALEENLAALEKGKHALCFSSGCAAADAVMHSLKSGDHVICGDDVYGGTFRIFDKIFKPLGIEFSFIDISEPRQLAHAVRAETKMVWLESPTNPLLKVTDLVELSRLAKERGLTVVVDNTFSSPYLQNPLELGADVVVHSSTKYIGGHSDVVGGAIITNDDALAERLRFIQNAVGAVPAPLDCFLLLRSTKTLALRMERHCDNAEAVAAFLNERSDVERVVYPGLSSHPQHEIAKRQMRRFGGMISVYLEGGLSRARKFLESVRLFTLAESLGGVESLIEHPAIMTHASIPAEIRASLGISDSLVRLSVGIEDIDDLIADLRQALDVSQGA
ncbi:MAG: cystathionine gamma-synthase [Bdellovibrionales bacterium]|nr:cystathionine gamma-synthase [Bdellovibrionales bacterium]